LIAANVTVVVDMQLAAAMPAAQKPGEQHLALSYGAIGNGTAVTCRIVRDGALIALELFPADIGGVLFLERNIPFSRRTTHAMAHALAAVNHAHRALRASKSIGPSIDGIGEDIVHGVVRRQSPYDSERLRITQIDGQLDTLVPEPDLNLPNTLELREFGKDQD